MAVAAAARPVQNGQSGPRSPTLSDAGMILPEGHARVVSLELLKERPPSPPVLYSHTNSSHVQLAQAPQRRRRPSQQSQSPVLSTQSSRSTLRNMGDSNVPARRAPSRDNALASSPTIHNGFGSTPPKDWSLQDQRRASVASSMLSEDFENWPGFDSHDAFDDSGLGLEDQERRDHFPGDEKHGDDMDGDRWPGHHSSGSDEGDDPYSSAALSRRAEIILANAKKRLNVMEGNLRGARESLVVSPTFSSSRSSSDLSHHINTTRERDRRLYAGLGPIPPRMPSFRSSVLYPSTPNHSRGLSETSVPLPFSSPSYLTRSSSNKRASSAFGHNSGPWSAEGFGQGRFPIKESRSVEVMRNPRDMQISNESQHPLRTTSRNSRSSPALETLPEDDDGDDKRVHRSASAASGLRDQMNDLKGRISSLKMRAQEDQLRRRSMQSLRGSSPFTNAREWHSGSDTYNAGEAPHTANAGLGIQTESLSRQALYEEGQRRPHTPETTLSEREGEKLVNHETGVHSSTGNGRPEAPYYSETDDFDDLESYDDEKDFDEAQEGDLHSTNDEDLEPSGESVYEDAVYEMAATERHEDRVDAFDYEHFFLHSAMGTYSMEGRPSSVGSGSSTETTRPVTAVQVQEDDEISDAEKRLSLHGRSQSSDSISTVASFATAAENQSDDDDEENEQMDQFSEQILAQHQPRIPRPATSNSHTSLRSDSAINMRRSPGFSPPQTSIARGSASPADLASGLQVSKIFSILTEATSPAREEPRLALSEEEKRLIYSLASSFQQVCSNLQHTYSEQYDRKAWRRRLDEARRALDGETEDDDSF